MADSVATLNSFIRNFEEQFDEVETGSLDETTAFRDLEEWSSMQALIVITSFDEHYEVTLSGEEIKSALTLKDLFDLVTSKMS